MSQPITDFGELRSAVQSSDEVSRKRAWRQIYLFFEAELSRRDRSDLVAQEWLPYALQCLERWPDRLRYLPKEALARVLDGEHLGELMALVKAVRIHQAEESFEVDLFDVRDFSWVRHVTFGPGVFGPDSHHALKDSEVFQRLTSIDIHRQARGKLRLATVLKAPFARNLTHLGLIDVRLDEARIKTLSRWHHLKNLTSLDLSKNPGLSGAWHHLAAAQVPSLRELDVSGSWLVAGDMGDLLDASWLSQLTALSAQRSYDALGDELSFAHLDRFEVTMVRRAMMEGPRAVAALSHHVGYRGPRIRKKQVDEAIRRLERLLRKLDREEGIDEMLAASDLPGALAEGALEARG